MKKIGNVAKAVVYRSLITNQTHACAAQQVNLFSQQSFDAQLDRLSILRHFSFQLAAQDRTAVHVKDFTVDVPRPLGAKENDRPADVFRRRYATNRNGTFDRLAKTFIRKDIRAHVSVDPSRRNGIDIDAKRSKFGPQRFCESDLAALRSRIVRDVRFATL